MSLKSQFKTDAKTETEGFWFEPAINEENGLPIRFKLARSGGGNKRYTKAFEEASRPYRAILNMKGDSPAKNEAAEKVMLKTFVNGILLDWDNVPKADVTGKVSDKGVVEFSVENAEKLIKELPELHRLLAKEAEDVDNYREKVQEDIAGN